MKDPWWVKPLIVFCAACPIVGLVLWFVTGSGAWLALLIPGIIFLGG